MRAAKRFAVAGIVAVLTVGIAPVTAAGVANGTINPMVTLCCKG